MRVYTPFLRESISPVVRLVNAYVAGTIALGRVGQPDDIGGAVAAILSDDMGWANGTTFDISGGQAI